METDLPTFMPATGANATLKDLYGTNMKMDTNSNSQSSFEGMMYLPSSYMTQTIGNPNNMLLYNNVPGMSASTSQSVQAYQVSDGSAVNSNSYYLMQPQSYYATVPSATQYTIPPEFMKKCHLHTKPQLSCKFCRKYKIVNQLQPQVIQEEVYQQESSNEMWSTVEMNNTSTYNVNSLLRENILLSEYFKSLSSLTTCDEVVDEIVNYADHAEPYCAGSTRAPSTLFCCLYKLFTLRLKQYEVQNLLDSTQSPYVRCVGFLYLRYVAPTDKLWDWFCPYFLDDETFSPGADKQQTTTMGEYVESLLTEDRYFSTVLPRIPVKLKSQYGIQFISMPSHRRRRAYNKAHLEQFKPGVPVAACCDGQWIEASLVVVDDPESSQAACQIQIGDEEENTKVVDLGLVIVLDAKIRQMKRQEERERRHMNYGGGPLIKRSVLLARKRSMEQAQVKNSLKINKAKKLGQDLHSRHVNSQGNSESPFSNESCNKEQFRERSRSFSRSLSNEKFIESPESPLSSHDYNEKHKSLARQKQQEDDEITQQEMLREFRRREQAKVLASGRDYARRPTSYKSSLSLKFNRQTIRKRERSPPVQTVHVDLQSESKKKPQTDSECLSQTELTKVEPSIEHQRRMAQLVQKYTKATTQ